VFTTKVTHLGSLLFRQQDGVNCVVRSLFWGVSQNRVVQSVAYNGVRKGGLGLTPPPLVLDILQKVEYLRKGD